MAKIFGSPSRYVQGPGVLKTESHYLKQLGQRGMLITDEIVWEICGKSLAEQLKGQGLSVYPLFLDGHSSDIEIERMTEAGKGQVDFVMALGGGKAIDVGKSVSHQLKVPVAVIPTAASTDAPTSAISVIYSTEGVFEGYRYYHKNPELVLVDTAIMIQAPAFLLASGIADGLATYVEARTVMEQGRPNLLGGQPTIAAIALAEKCQEVLFEHGVQGVADNQAKELTASFEAVVEANTLLSGLGFESGGLAVAHAVQNGLSILSGKIQTLTHGQKVAFGTLTQLVLEERHQEISTFIELFQRLGLPTTLADLFIEASDQETLAKVAMQATIPSETSHYVAGEMTPQGLVEAMLEADRRGRELLHGM